MDEQYCAMYSSRPPGASALECSGVAAVAALACVTALSAVGLSLQGLAELLATALSAVVAG